MPFPFNPQLDTLEYPEKSEVLSGSNWPVGIYVGDCRD